MATSSFDRPFVLQDDEAVANFIYAMEHPAPPIPEEQKREIREMLERGEELAKKTSCR